MQGEASVYFCKFGSLCLLSKNGRSGLDLYRMCECCRGFTALSDMA